MNEGQAYEIWAEQEAWENYLESRAIMKDYQDWLGSVEASGDFDRWLQETDILEQEA